MMTAITIREPGGPDVLVPTERPVPIPGPKEIFVAAAAAGVNRPDVMQRTGHYPPPPGASDVPGLQISALAGAKTSIDLFKLLAKPRSRARPFAAARSRTRPGWREGSKNAFGRSSRRAATAPSSTKLFRSIKPRSAPPYRLRRTHRKDRPDRQRPRRASRSTKRAG